MFSVVCVHICFSKLEKRPLLSMSGLVSPPFSLSERLTTSLLNHPLISLTSFDVSNKLKQINITEYTTSACCQPHQIGYETLLATANIKDEIWNYLSWHHVYFDFKHALFGM